MARPPLDPKERRGAIEESPEEFLRRFLEHRMEVELSPEPWGCPLLEALTPLGPLYAFDRGAPPAPVGRALVLLHGVAEWARPLLGEPYLERARDRYRLGGEAAPLGGGFYLLRIPGPRGEGVKLVVYWEGEMPGRAEVGLLPPLMLFR